MALSPEQLSEWDERICEIVLRLGLKPYAQEFEICDHFEMIGYIAYSGMPSRYPHWSFGKGYEVQKTLYDYGVGGLPYEMVINSNPCLAYLMRDNTDLLNVLTIAHVYAHNDFFANNYFFTSAIDANYVIEMFKNHADRIRDYVEDPSIGIDAVESLLDAAHALSLQRSRNPGLRSLSREEQQMRMWEAAQLPEDEFADINPTREYQQPDLSKNPLNPEENLLQFIGNNNPFLAEWQRDVIHIVDEESRYFLPQIETKIMNEGWASFWHFKILNQLSLPQDYHLEFLVRHNQVLRPTPGGLNPYHLGFVIWKDIERRWNEGDTGREWTSDKPEVDLSTLDENDQPGRKKIFQVRQGNRDVSFLRRFLTEEIMRELDLFQHEKRGKERIITKISDEESWKDVKESLIQNVGMGSIPSIKIVDADYGDRRTLYLLHDHDGRDLQLEYAERTLKHLQVVWGREVVLESIVNEKKSLLKLINDSLKVERL